MDLIKKLSGHAAPELVMTAFAQHAPVGIQIYDASGTCIYVNPRFTLIFGAPPPPGYSVLNDELVQAAGHIEVIRNAFRGQPGRLPLIWYDASQLRNLGPADLEYTRSLGKKCAIETHLVPILTDGEVRLVIFIYKDVTAELFMQEERERALKERDDAKAMIQSVLNEAQAVIYIKDLEGRYLFVNGQFCRVFNIAQDRVLGRFESDVHGQETAAAFRHNDLHIQRTRIPLETEEIAIHADGTKHTYISLKFPLYSSVGELTGVCGVSTDITEHRKMERELAAAKRMETIGLLAGGIAHDFNNTIEVILLAVDTLMMGECAGRPEAKALLEAMKRSAQNAAGMTRQLLTFGKTTSLQKQPVDLGDLVVKTTELLNKALGADVALKTEIEPKRWIVNVDPSQVEQALLNVCFNARDAMNNGGRILIKVRNLTLDGSRSGWRIGKPIGDYVELRIEDTGTGITPENLERIFEPFFTTKKEGSGSGLGLATVYGVMRNSGGDVAVESRIGAGTTFRLVFPRSAGSPAIRQPGPDLRPVQANGETILLVEDDEILRTVTASLLRESGFRVVEAGGAEEGLRRWNALNRQIDLLITDVVMPDGNGMEMIAAMNRESAGRPPKTILVSAYPKRLDDQQVGADMFEFLEKPYSGAELLAKIRQVLPV